MDTEVATENQIKFLHKLIGDAGMDKEELETEMGRKLSALDKDTTSRIIDLFVNVKDKELLTAKLSEMKSDEDETELPPPVPAPAVAKTQITPLKKPMVVEKAADKVELLATMNGIPKELANMYFMIIDGSLYIKSPGLLFMASKKGYAKIVVKTSYDEDKKEYQSIAMIYPKIPVDIIKALAGLSPEIQKEILDTQYGPTAGYGQASKENVKNTHMYPFLKELAETRAVNRALRLYTGYGGTSYEELPESNIEVE